MKQQTIGNISAALPLLALLALSGCNDPVFYTISQEVRARDARIKGTPTNIVYFKSYVYVASNVLFQYDGTADPLLQWRSFPAPQGKKIEHLAATEDYLYVLCSSGSGAGSTSLYYSSSPSPASGDWKEVNRGTLSASGYPYLFSIYAERQEGEHLFAGAWNGNGESNSPANYAVFWVDESVYPTLKTLVRGTGALSGAADAGSEYFISTANGIYRTSDPPAGTELLIESALVPGSANTIFPGIIQLKPGGQTVAVDRYGYIYTVTAGGITPATTLSGTTPVPARTGYKATGALATYKRNTLTDTDPPELLLVGIQGDSGSSNYGYREINLDKTSGNLPAHITSYFPGNHTPSSIVDGNSSRYEATLGNRPVYYLYQAPKAVDSLMTLFAATATDGLFSYRYRDENWQWNAEE